MAFSGDKEVQLSGGCGKSRWPALPHVLVQTVGVAVGLVLGLACLKLEMYASLPWWAVGLPAIIALCIIWVVLTIAIILWVRTAARVFGPVDIEPDSEFRLDMVFRTAKICFLGHGYVMLLVVSLCLVFAKLHIWPHLPLAYALLPLIVIGLAHIFLAVIFKPPEVDPPWFFLVGMVLMSQSILLVIKVDHMFESDDMAWAVTFTPSWLTYLLLLIYCAVSPLQAFHETEESTGSSSASFPYGSVADRATSSSMGRLQAQLSKVMGISSWALGWGFAQAFLSLRLDKLFKVSWFSVILPALMGWILLVVFVSGHVTAYFTDIFDLFGATFRLGHSNFDFDDQEPLINYSYG